MLLPNFKIFHPSNFHETNQPTSDWIHIFHPKLMKEILIFDRNKFLHDPTWKFQLANSCSNFGVLGQKFSSTDEIRCLACMTSLSVLELSHLRFSWKVVIMYKTSQNSLLIFRIVSNAFYLELSSCDSSPSLATLADGKASKADKMSSTHPNLIALDVFSFMSQGEHMRKKWFW